MNVAIVAFGAVSPFGEGGEAIRSGHVGERARVAIARDSRLASAGLLRPFAARASLPREERGGDRAAALLERALAGCASELDRVAPDWRGQRVGLVLGTSAGAMGCAEAAFAALERGEALGDPEAPTYYGPTRGAARLLGVAVDPCVVVLGACASATLAIGIGKRCLERGSCDLVLAGGFDELTLFVAAGFEALRATTGSVPPRPFRRERDGMSLGEGAAVVALAPEALVERREVRAFVTGFGAASDAVHLTAPDREGRGLARAAASALAEAGTPDIALVSAHATATPLNDAAELHGLLAALGHDGVARAVLHPFKAQIGHTLGASGALETLAALDAMERSVLPASAGEGTPEPTAEGRILATSQASGFDAFLKVSAAFGGANAALVVSKDPGPDGRARAFAYVGGVVVVPELPSVDALAARVGIAPERLARADLLVHLALDAVARLEAREGPLAGSGLVLGTALGTLETNALFAARLRQAGATSVEPRRFPYTSPNAACGECSVAFGLTGPAFAVGGGLHAPLEALACAALLVEAGDIERVVVVAADDAGPVAQAVAPAVRSGAIAVLVSRERGPHARGRIGGFHLRREAHAVEAEADSPVGHALLAPLLGDVWPTELRCAATAGVRASVTLDPL